MPHVFQSIMAEHHVAHFVESLVDVAEFVCPPLKEFLSWDFGDLSEILTPEDLCAIVQEEGWNWAPVATTSVIDLFQQHGDFLPHAASAA
ncbi:hypothetical protein Poli38472_008175 [Pythium oligandrum]|uniref:Uncharacterized protein n=1 Tax=Pythium oligandrum TaxID=41045 RepID=A0A8K1FPE3_PYTOL|nr:hypothetical protein Poli38472_008175 [Pythium oligandrum]|eukprot:TMW65533.1 hypothetical protein Poli38472_008175 [Pythium oligandrum]